MAEKHQFTALAPDNLGNLSTLEKQYSRAGRLIREALATYNQILPAGALNTAIAQARLGHVLVGEKRYQEAEQYSFVT